MKRYPSAGDGGRSPDPDGVDRPKDDPWFEAVGAVDEVNSLVGWARAACLGDPALAGALARMQGRLLEVGAIFYARSAEAPACLGTGDMERDIAEWSRRLEPLRHFIVPGGCEAACRLHVARCSARRAERRVVALRRADPEQVPEALHTFLNRLSDWLFTAARFANFAAGITETPWRGRGGRSEA